MTIDLTARRVQRMTPRDAIALAPRALLEGNPLGHPPIFVWFTKRASELKFLRPHSSTNWGDHASQEEWEPEWSIEQKIIALLALAWLTLFMVGGYLGALNG